MDLTLLGAFLYLACGGAVILLGLLVLREAPGDRLRRTAAAMMFFGGLGPIVGGAGMILARRGPEAVAFLGTDAATTLGYAWELFFPSLLLFALLFPTEHPLLGRFPRAGVLLYFPYFFHLVLLFFLGRIGSSLAGFEIPAPFGIGGSVGDVFRVGGSLIGLTLRLLARFHVRFFSLVDLLFIGAAILLLRQSYRRLESPRLRRQLRAVLFGLGPCVGLYALAVPGPTLISHAVPAGARLTLLTAALLLGTGSIAFAVVRASFLDVGTVFRRAFLLSGAAGALVLGLFFLARWLDGILEGQLGFGMPLCQGLFALLAILFFHPALGRLEETIDRVLAGDRVANREMLRRLGREMTAILDLRPLSDEIVRSLKESLGVDRVHLFLRDRTGRAFAEAGSNGEGEPFVLEEKHPLFGPIGETLDSVTAGDLVEELVRPEERREAAEFLARRHARIVVPIHVSDGGGCHGFLTIGPKATGSRFHAEEVGLLSILSQQIGFAVRNARLHEEALERALVDEELAMARAIQESIVPRRRPEFPGLDVAALNLPSRQMGGDYYDLIPLPGGALAVAVGDVSGKGIPAALLMSMLHAALHVQMNGNPEPALLMSRLNRILYDSTSPEQFATFFFGVYDRGASRLRFTNGGHNFPVLLRKNGSVECLVEGGLVLGFTSSARYEEGRVDVNAEDLLVFYSDGVTEEAREDDEQFGEERLIDTVRRHRSEPAAAIVEAVREEVSRFAGRERFGDDFTLIVLRAGEGVSL
ncbi:MAG: GAF domain-containing SpoIIE family protein phosphatase [Candidatus Eisenbacteria bacterium]